MNILQNILIILAAFSLGGASADYVLNFPALRTIFSFIGGDLVYPNKTKDIVHMTPEELGRSNGQCQYNFIFYVSYSDRFVCSGDDKYILHLLTNEGPRKPPIMIKCLESEANPQNHIVDMTSVKDIMELLKPIGNSTKRTEPGSCVFIIFYSWSSLSCVHTVPSTNVLPTYFPTLRFAAIDAYKFTSFNTEFGIVGLPTLLLFHQGRPIVKLTDSGNLVAFVTRHTGIKPVSKQLGALEEQQRLEPIESQSECDFVLILAWTFIFVCLGNYFSKTRLSKQIVEMIKRNWRESEAQLERN